MCRITPNLVFYTNERTANVEGNIRTEKKWNNKRLEKIVQ